jgi:hypothetical protein
MEADFNATNKVIYGVRMLANVRKYMLMPEEVYSERNRLAEDETLSKVLFYKLSDNSEDRLGWRRWTQTTATTESPIPWHQWSSNPFESQHRQLSQCSQQSRT